MRWYKVYYLGDKINVTLRKTEWNLDLILLADNGKALVRTSGSLGVIESGKGGLC